MGQLGLRLSRLQLRSRRDDGAGPADNGDQPDHAREQELEQEVSGLRVSLAHTRTATRRLAMEATADPLTGLANRRGFQRTLDTEVERAQRYDRALSVVCLDIDGFKEVNDAYGHDVGDRVLTQVAERLLTAARANDLVARLGGDEFAVIMPETSAAAAEVVAQRAHEMIRIDLEGTGPSITVSIGICDLEHASDAEQLMRFADGALFWAKSHGSDAVWRYSPEAVDELSDEQRLELLERTQAMAGLRALARTVDAKGHFSDLHSERVASLVRRLADALDWPPERAAALHEAALVHDIGKLVLPDELLCKAGRLTPKEYELVKAHAALGAQVAHGVLTDEQVEWLRGHHERYDGSGYPDGLAGEDIPDGARVLALADSWDVMTSQRPYATAMTPTEALEECRRESGKQFAPDLIEVLTGKAFERTLRVFANEQAARDSNEKRLVDASGPLFELCCECGAEDCDAQVMVPAREYHAIRAYTRRYIIKTGHELPNDERVITSAEQYTVVEKA
jgi:diguanylate cyclase (GGDEF)-like protein